MLRAGVRPRHLLTVLAAVGLVSAVFWHFYTRTGRLLQAPSWVTAVLVALLAGLVLWSGWQVRAYQRGEGPLSFTALRAARALGLAQAGALTGSAVAGWFLGHLAILLPDRDLTPYGRQVLPLVVVIATGVALAVAGLVAQRWCRLPEDSQGPGDPAGPVGG
jgi:hypothetical protein